MEKGKMKRKRGYEEVQKKNRGTTWCWKCRGEIAGNVGERKVGQKDVEKCKIWYKCEELSQLFIKGGAESEGVDENVWAW